MIKENLEEGPFTSEKSYSVYSWPYRKPHTLSHLTQRICYRVKNDHPNCIIGALSYGNLHQKIKCFFCYPHQSPEITPELDKEPFRSHGNLEKSTMRSFKEMLVMHFKYTISVSWNSGERRFPWLFQWWFLTGKSYDWRSIQKLWPNSAQFPVETTYNHPREHRSQEEFSNVLSPLRDRANLKQHHTSRKRLLQGWLYIETRLGESAAGQTAPWAESERWGYVTPEPCLNFWFGFMLSGI